MTLTDDYIIIMNYEYEAFFSPLAFCCCLCSGFLVSDVVEWNQSVPATIFKIKSLHPSSFYAQFYK